MSGVLSAGLSDLRRVPFTLTNKIEDGLLLLDFW